MSFKCPDCGATLTDDSRFCKYCGAKIDDGVQRSEIKIEKRIEDVAEIHRAEYEERESNLRIRKMERQMKQQKSKRITFFVLLAFSIVAWIVGSIMSGAGNANGGAVEAIGIFGTLGTGASIVMQLLNGKW